jgi:hypothetical protein
VNAAAPSTWSAAAERLARRVERRERLGASASAFGTGLAVGSAAALAAHLLGAPAAALPLLGAGALAGLGAGLLRARRVPRVGPEHAAWALDRLAGAKERGLTAALLGPERAGVAEGPPPEPPSVRLHPPRGLSLLAGGGVLAALVVVVGGRADGSPTDADEPTERVVGHVAAPPGGSGGANGRPDGARGAERRAVAAEEVRRALGLSAAEGEDPALVEQRLSDPEARAAARAAADPASALAEALGGERPSAEAVARGLAAGRRDAEALEAARRAELAGAAASALPPLPAARRALVERYFLLRTEGTR